MEAGYRSNLEEQVAEVELLQAMFPGPGELQLDPGALEEVQDWLESSIGQSLPSTLEFRLVLQVEKEKIEVVVTLPQEYPALAGPEVYVRAERLSRAAQAEINCSLGLFLEGEGVIVGEPCLVAVVSWLQEHSLHYFSQQEEQVVQQEEGPQKLLRFWVYSHHIYSKIKRKDLQGLASDLNLTGFVMPGKPGVICVEGSARDVSDWWAIVRNWQWKHIRLKVEEEEEAATLGQLEDSRVFRGFQEVGVLKDTQRGNHMDMAEFQKYLQQHNVEWVFNELFGIDRS